MSEKYEEILNSYFSSKGKTPKEHAIDIWNYAGYRRAGTIGDKKASEIISLKFKEEGADEVIIDKFFGKNKAPPISLVILFLIYSCSFILYSITIFFSNFY
ncbi:MAG: hypothetical protein ACTSQJ_13835, partial [Promethearchaeota archaeon]